MSLFEKIVMPAAGIHALILVSVVTAAKPTGQRLKRELCKSLSTTIDIGHQHLCKSYTHPTFHSIFPLTCTPNLWSNISYTS